MEIFANIRIAFGLLTRIPVGTLGVVRRSSVPINANQGGASPAGSIGRASAYFPIVGLVVGVIGGAVLWAAAALSLPPSIGAALAILALVLATGALHEDGLADSADGLGLKRPEARILEIMRDSRIGVFGVIAVVASLGFRWAALSAIAAISLGQAVTVLIAAAVVSRAAMPVIMAALPPARSDGLAHDAGRPGAGQVAAGIVIAAVIVILVLDLSFTVTAVAVAAIAVGGFAWFVNRRIGGQTGDTLGACQQIAEIAVLLTAAAWVSAPS
ncbi:MAG: adenosylcobinamide-GDP ribazoletransferase [Proteobacteria bacterium]|nr:adenosylcobinamide-GDP ribazoletransferase [Pseudomonadota bacterium]